jgi:hypothetical protein
MVLPDCPPEDKLLSPPAQRHQTRRRCGLDGSSCLSSHRHDVGLGASSAGRAGIVPTEDCYREVLAIDRLWLCHRIRFAEHVQGGVFKRVGWVQIDQIRSWLRGRRGRHKIIFVTAPRNLITDKDNHQTFSLENASTFKILLKLSLLMPLQRF